MFAKVFEHKWVIRFFGIALILAPFINTARSVLEIPNIEKKFLVGVGRQQDIVKVRDITVYILRKYGGLSFPAIGKLLGNRDHTTIIHAFRKIEAQAKVSKDFEYESYNLIAEARKLKARVLETERLSTPSLTSFARSGVSIKNFSKPIEISQRSNKVLNLYRQGLVLQDIGEKIGVTRERARQIIVKTIKQKAFNESLRKGVKVDFETLLTREKEIRRLAIESNKPIKLPKQAKIRGWSLYHDSCKSCGTTEVKHFVHGLCEDCGNKSITGDAREQMVSDHNNKCDLCNISREQAIKDYGRDFYLSRKLKSVLCRRCFLEEMGKKLADTKRNKWKMFYN